MKKNLLLTILVATVLATMSTHLAANDSAGKTFYERGMQHVAATEYVQAAEAFKAAYKAEPENMSYKKQYSKLHNITRMQTLIQDEESNEKWFRYAKSLRIFYTNNNDASRLIALCQQMRERDPSITTTNILSEALIKVGEYQEAENLLASISPEEASRITLVLQGLAAAHLNKTDHAEATLVDLAENESVSMGLLFRIARLQALLGHHADASESMATILKAAHPKSHAGLKRVVNNTLEFQPLLTDVEFVQALATKSEKPEKEDDCATCPNRSTCKERAEKESCDGDDDCDGQSCSE
ncbi:hypothetical protein KS4_09050 [Poriferisphaera corsica]|uniref:Uncharacterized protein n=1 Tax=Poriferisphaera corsica TaxID=2528020 RepID=A0A517YRM2_9BACT|nr:hypothetical protein [Poriferisphaera corsica]QDU32867.1 hypothetical protein KS4_09050 [Poriferisphaera corsica]